MRILTFSTLYPNAAQPNHGLFVEHRIRRLARQPGIDLQVIAPVPWFPSDNAIFGNYAQYANVPAREMRHDLSIAHPRYITIPKVGMSIAPALLALGAYRAFVRHLRSNGHIDLIDAHYFYPDGVAAAMLSEKLGIPFIITARGTDINLIPKYALPRRKIRWAAHQASHIVTVCSALKDAIIDLGVEPQKITPLRNGVDLELFRPADKGLARKRFGFTSPTLVSVGHLIERKGHHIAIDAVSQLSGVNLVIVGDGPMRQSLEQRVRKLGIQDRVRLDGALPQTQLPLLYSAADALVLASDREGMANVLLEALACGTPVVATSVWGTPEVVTDSIAGQLVERTPESLAAGISALLADPPARHEVRRYAKGYSWDNTISGLLEVVQRAAARR